MMTRNSVEALLNANPDPSRVEYRNAWNTVAARIWRTKAPNKLADWIALQDRMAAIGAPKLPTRVSRGDALQRAQDANKARAIGRGRASILRKIEEAKYLRALVTDQKPWLFEAALQMLEDGTVSLHSCTHDFAERGPAAVDGRRKIRRMILAPADPHGGRKCPWISEKKQAEQEERI